MGAKKQAELANSISAAQYDYDIKSFFAQKADLEREVELTNQLNKETFEYQQELRNIERLSLMDQYDKSQDQYKQQLVWNQQAADAAVASQNNVYQQRVSETQQSFEDQEIAMERTVLTAGYNLDQAEFTLSQALYNADQTANAAEQDYKSQILSIDADRSNLTKARDQIAIQKINIENRARDAIADRNFEQFTAEIEKIQSLGAEAARGRKGGSTQAAMQTAYAAFAFNTAKISDALYRSKQALESERQQVAAEERSVGREEGFATRRETLAQESKDLTIAQTVQQKEFSQTAAKLDIQKLSDELDIDIRVFENNATRLGEELVNAATAREFAISEISRGKVQADIQADAQRMLPLRFAPDPPRPYAAEMPTLVEPPKPIRVRSGVYTQPQPKGQSGISKVLSIGGAILGIAGAAFTGGASLGLTMGLGTVGAASAVGVGLGAASGGLGLISKYTY